MAGNSIYEVENYKDIAKPNDGVKEDDYRQDVFFMTRPEVFDYDDHTHDKNPYFEQCRNDELTQDKELSDQKYVHNPHNWDDQKPYLQGPFKKYNVEEVIANYRIENEPGVIEIEQIIEGHLKTAQSIYDIALLMSKVNTFHNKIKYEDISDAGIRLLREDLKNRVWTYKVISSTAGHDSKGHVVVIRLDKSSKEKNILKVKVKFSCSCPYWKYHGPDEASEGHYREGPRRRDRGKDLGKDNRNMSKKDKEKYPLPPGYLAQRKTDKLKNLYCKHVYAVMNKFSVFVKENNLDTYEEIEQILELINKEIEFINIEEVKEIYDMLEGSDKKILAPLIRAFDKEKSEKRKAEILIKLANSLKIVLQNKSKGFLSKVLKQLKTKLVFVRNNELTKVMDNLRKKPDIDKLQQATNLLDKTEKAKLNPLIKRYNEETNDTKRQAIYNTTLNSFRNTIRKKEKSDLDKILDYLLKIMGIKKSSSLILIAKPSLDKVLELYMTEILGV